MNNNTMTTSPSTSASSIKSFYMKEVKKTIKQSKFPEEEEEE